MGVKEGGFGRKPVASPHPSFVCRSMGVALSVVLCLGGVSIQHKEEEGECTRFAYKDGILLRNFGAAEMNLLQGKEAS